MRRFHISRGSLISEGVAFADGAVAVRYSWSAVWVLYPTVARLLEAASVAGQSIEWLDA